MGAATCKSCEARIVWVETEGGKKMPLDYVPTVDGNVVIRGGAAHVLHDGEQPGPREGRYTCHFQTCPDATKHRGAARGNVRDGTPFADPTKPSSTRWPRVAVGAEQIDDVWRVVATVGDGPNAVRYVHSQPLDRARAERLAAKVHEQGLSVAHLVASDYWHPEQRGRGSEQRPGAGGES